MVSAKSRTANRRRLVISHLLRGGAAGEGSPPVLVPALMPTQAHGKGCCRLRQRYGGNPAWEIVRDLPAKPNLLLARYFGVSSGPAAGAGRSIRHRESARGTPGRGPVAALQQWQNAVTPTSGRETGPSPR